MVLLLAMPIFNYLNVNGRVKGSVIKSLHDSKKYATFIEFDENGKERNRYEYNPSTVFTDFRGRWII